MTLSFFTNSSSMLTNKALMRANLDDQIAMQRLGSGKRINSAADDSAGLQIFTRLSSQSNGMDAAKRNIADAKGLLQTAEGTFNEVTNIMDRMKYLATQSANETNATNDRDAIQAEFTSLNDELKSIMKNTNYGGEKLFNNTTASGSGHTATAEGKLRNASGVYFQIGESQDEGMTVNLAPQLTKLDSSIAALSGVKLSASGASVSNALKAIGDINDALKNVGAVQSTLGAYMNRLDHTANNLVNMQDNTKLAIGSIRDANIADEATNHMRSQLLMQSSIKMLQASFAEQGMLMSLLG